MLNLGQGGQYPLTYARIAGRAVPALKPDLIIVAVLQADDLHQTMHLNSAKALLKSSLKNLFPNFIVLVKDKASRDIKIKSNWIQIAKSLYGEFNEKQTKRFDSLEPELKQKFFGGDLYPQLISFSVRYPDFFAETLDLHDLDVKDGIVKMSLALREIKQIGERHGAERVVVSVPMRTYVCPEDIRYVKQLGFRLDEEILASENADKAIKLTAEKAGVDFFDVSGIFKEACIRKSLYFKYDGHFNDAGNRTFSDAILPFIQAKISGEPRAAYVEMPACGKRLRFPQPLENSSPI